MAKPILSRYIRPEVLAHIAHLAVQPRGLVEGHRAGEHRSPAHGFAIEFASHRPYVAGDDIRHIDWRVYYRHHRLLIKQYEMETNLNCHLVLDISASMRYGEGEQRKLEYAAQLASALAYLVLERGDRVSFAAIDQHVRSTVPASSIAGQVVRMAEALDQVDAIGKTDFGMPLMELAPTFGRRGIVVLLTDALCELDALDRTLQRLRYDKHEVVLFHIMHHDELTFGFNQMTRFVGLESEQTLLTRPSEVRRSYLAALRQFTEKLEAVCESNRCERVLCDTSRPLGETLADYLQQRTLVASR